MRRETRKNRYDPIPDNSESNLPRNRLSCLNLLNVFAFLVNFLGAYAIASMGMGGHGTNKDLTLKNMTILTPDMWAFAIWWGIYFSEAVFIVAQLLPRYRATPLVRSGVGVWYIGVCCFQIPWGMYFSREAFWPSVGFTALTAFCMVGLIRSQYLLEGRTKWDEYLLLKFPFELHCGWLTMAAVLNTNCALVKNGIPPGIEVAVALVSVAAFLSSAVLGLFGLLGKPSYTIALVQVYASATIALELSNPREELSSRFDKEILTAMCFTAALISSVILFLVVFRLTAASAERLLQTADIGNKLRRLSQNFDAGNKIRRLSLTIAPDVFSQLEEFSPDYGATNTSEMAPEQAPPKTAKKETLV